MLIAGIAEDHTAAANDNRDLIDSHFELVQHFLHAGIFVKIEIGVRMAVASEKLFYPQSARGVRRTDERHVADVIGDQLQPAKNEGGHKHLADADVGLHNSLHFLGTKFDYLACLTHPARIPASGGR